MTGFAYICFVFAVSVIGALLGGLGHFWRAHATMFAEDLGLGEPLDTLTRDDYQFEKHVVGAEWDDAGFWAPDSVRNFIYYVASGFSCAAAPWHWILESPQRNRRSNLQRLAFA